MMIVVDVINKGKCIVCGKEATDLLFCDDCNRKRKEIEMTREKLQRAKDIEKRIEIIDKMINCYDSHSNAIIGICIVRDELGDVDPIFTDYNILLAKKFQDDALKILKEYRASLEEEFKNL